MGIANARELPYQFSLKPVLDFDTDTEQADAHHGSPSPSPGVGVGVGLGIDWSVDTATTASAAEMMMLATPTKQRKGPSGGAISKKRPAGLPSHTKLCRDRLNGMFEQLRRTLPAAPIGVEVKHKAQVLDYAISVLKNMVERTSELEIELAISSNRATMEWITKLSLLSNSSFLSIAGEVMRVFIKRRGWNLGELWISNNNTTGTSGSGNGNLGQKKLVFGIAITNNNPGLEEFVERSKNYEFAPGVGVQGRVYQSLRPEWLAGLKYQSNFIRSNLAVQFGIKTCLAIPIIVSGKIEGVFCFYDIRHRPYDPQCVDLAMRLTWALGNATGGKRAASAVANAAHGSTK